jgi:hypothetical protein
MVNGKAAANKAYERITATREDSYAHIVRRIAAALGLRVGPLPIVLSAAQPVEGSVTLGMGSLDFDGIAEQLGLEWDIKDGVVSMKERAAGQ